METTLVVLKYIRDYMAIYPWAPTLKEIADGCELSWASSVTRHLDRLVAWGLIEREPGKARSIALTEKGEHFPL